MDKFKNLRLYNGLMGILHFIQAGLMLLLSNQFSLPVNTNYIYFNEFTQSLEPVVKTVINLRIGPLVALFLLISSFAHFTLTLPRIYEWYVKNLQKGINYARWVEYSISSSLMIVIIAMLTGMYDLSSLILIFTLNAMMILFGMIMEVHNQTTKKTNWLSFIFGCIAGAVPWLTIALYLYGAGGRKQGPPDFVYVIFFTIFLFFNSFAVNMVLQYKEVGKWNDYVFGEKVYILMSLIAKSALAWQVFAGTLRPQ